MKPFGLLPHAPLRETVELRLRIDDLPDAVREPRDRPGQFVPPMAAIPKRAPDQPAPRPVAPRQDLADQPEAGRPAAPARPLPNRDEAVAISPEPDARVVAQSASERRIHPPRPVLPKPENWADESALPKHPAWPDVNGAVAAAEGALVRNQESLLRGLQKLTALVTRQQSDIDALHRELETLDQRARNSRDGR